MKKSKKIFIVLRSVDDNRQVAAYGLEVARQLENPACLFAVQHVYTPTEMAHYGGMASGYPVAVNMPELMKQTEKSLTELRDELCRSADECEVRVEVGFLESVVVDEAEKDARMVVIGKQNKLNLINEVLGTFESRIAEQLEAPVLVVPPQQNYKPIHNIAYIVDFSEENLSDLQRLSEIAKAFGAKITILTIWDEDKEEDYIASISELQNMVSSGYVRYERIGTEKAADKIHAYVSEHDIDWLAFHQTDENFFQRIYSDFNTEHLILEQEIPVLVF